MSPIRILTLLFSFIFTYSLPSQDLKTFVLQDTSLMPGISGQLMETDNGSYVLIGASSFGFDSAYLHLIELDETFQSNASNSFALFGLTSFNDAEATTDGFLLGGTIISPAVSWPYLIKTDQNLDVAWSLLFDNLAISQTQIVKVFSDSTDFTAFSYSSPGNKIIHRITGDLNGNITGGHSIENTNNRFRFYDGIRAGHPGTHIMGGSIENQTTNEEDAFIASWGHEGLRWNRTLDFGISGFEEFSFATAPVNGSFLATAINFNPDSSRSETFLFNMDTSGQVLWVKKVSLSTGNANFGGITQTANGEIYLFGLANNLEASLIKLSANAELIWTKKWIWPNEYWSGIQGLYVNPAGEILMQLRNMGDVYFAELDSTGASCNFETGPAIEISDFTDFTVDSLVFIESPLTVTTAPISPSPRELKLETSEYCSSMATSIEETEFQKGELIVFPQPSSDLLHLETQLPMEQAKIQILNLVGQIQVEMDYRSLISIKNLPKGWYILRIIQEGKSISKAFIKQ